MLLRGSNRHVTGRQRRTSLPFGAQGLLLLLVLALCTCLVEAQTSATTTTSASSSVSASSTPSTTRTISLSTLPTTLALDPLNASSPAIQLDFSQTPSLYITLNICSLGANTSVLPSAIVSLQSPADFAVGRTNLDPDSGGLDIPNKLDREGDPWVLEWNQGFANWTTNVPDNQFQASLLLAIGLSSDGSVDNTSLPANLGNIVLQIGASTRRPYHYISPATIFLGDTTPDSALLLSPLLMASPLPEPSYPNYTLPRAQMVFDGYPGAGSQTNLTTLGNNFRPVIVPTDSSPVTDGLDNSLCAVVSANSSTGYIANPANMLINATTRWMSVGGVEGFRTMWVVGGLVAETNYTAWLVDDQGGITEPMWFSTKEASFPCQLVVPNSLCPGIAYAAPLEANTTTLPDTSTPFPLETIPDDIASVITASLDHFSATLLSSACGRDLFSHVSSCADCYNAYRDWICRITVPQCASATASSGPVQPQTIVRASDSPRLASITSPYAYTELLPCLSICNRADRQCPAFVQFRCPRRHVNAQQSYAFLGEDNDQDDGDSANGEAASDRWGNRWCNA